MNGSLRILFSTKTNFFIIPVFRRTVTGMKVWWSMRKTRLIPFAIILSAVGLILIALSKEVSHKPPSYISFALRQSQTYYSQFADACEQVILLVDIGNTNDYRIQGDDPRLPAIIREMNATYVEADSNHVRVMISSIVAPYAAVWHRDEIDPKFWRLTAFGEGPSELYERHIK